MTLRASGSILLISCYELGHQPLGVSMPMGFLQRAGYAPAVMDIAVETFDEAKVAAARFVGISVPMHTALRLGVRVAERIRELNPDCRICFYGLYAALNAEYLLSHGGDFCIGGEYEAPLVELAGALESGGPAEDIEAVITRGRPAKPCLKRLEFTAPVRSALPTQVRRQACWPSPARASSSTACPLRGVSVATHSSSSGAGGRLPAASAARSVPGSITLTRVGSTP